MTTTQNTKPARRATRFNARPGTEVTFRRNGRLWTAIVGPSGKLICKRPA